MGGGGKKRLELRDFGEKRTVCVCVCVFVCVCVCVRGVVARIWIGENSNLTNTKPEFKNRKRKMEGHFRGLHSPLGIPFRDTEDSGG